MYLLLMKITDIILTVSELGRKLGRKQGSKEARKQGRKEARAD
jgi:hypothetical protein